MPTTSDNPNSSTVGRRIHGLFLAHPASINEGYFEHQRAALGFAVALLITAAAAFVHAIVPSLCECTARNRIASLNERLHSRANTESD